MEGVAGLAGGQVCPWRSNAHVLLRGDPIRERAQRVCSIAALSAATIVRRVGHDVELDISLRCHTFVSMGATRRPLVWLRGAVKSPPFSAEARLEAGVLLRRLQRGDVIGMPHARPMPALGARCGELRIPDATVTWRILYRLDADAVVIVEVFAKKTAATPANVLATGRARLRVYDRVTQGEG